MNALRFYLVFKLPESLRNLQKNLTEQVSPEIPDESSTLMPQYFWFEISTVFKICAVSVGSEMRVHTPLALDNTYTPDDDIRRCLTDNFRQIKDTHRMTPGLLWTYLKNLSKSPPDNSYTHQPW